MSVLQKAPKRMLPLENVYPKRYFLSLLLSGFAFLKPYFLSSQEKCDWRITCEEYHFLPTLPLPLMRKVVKSVLSIPCPHSICHFCLFFFLHYHKYYKYFSYVSGHFRTWTTMTVHNFLSFLTLSKMCLFHIAPHIFLTSNYTSRSGRLLAVCICRCFLVSVKLSSYPFLIICPRNLTFWL